MWNPASEICGSRGGHRELWQADQVISHERQRKRGIHPAATAQLTLARPAKLLIQPNTSSIRLRQR